MKKTDVIACLQWLFGSCMLLVQGTFVQEQLHPNTKRIAIVFAYDYFDGLYNQGCALLLAVSVFGFSEYRKAFFMSFLLKFNDFKSFKPLMVGGS